MAENNVINAPISAAGKALIDDASAAAQRTTMGVVIGTNVQAFDAGLLSIAGLTTAADKMIYTSGLDTYVVIDLTALGRSLLADATQAAMATTILSGASLSTATVAGTDKVLIQDVDDSNNIKTVTAQQIADLGGGGGGITAAQAISFSMIS